MYIFNRKSIYPNIAVRPGRTRCLHHVFCDGNFSKIIHFSKFFLFLLYIILHSLSKLTIKITRKKCMSVAL